MTKYRVKPGFRFGAYDQHEPGTVVEMTEAEAAGFKDKLERVVEMAPPEPPQGHQDAPPVDPAGTPDSPQEDIPSDPSDIPSDPPVVTKDEPEEPPAPEPEPPKGKKRS